MRFQLLSPNVRLLLIVLVFISIIFGIATTVRLRSHTRRIIAYIPKIFLILVQILVVNIMYCMNIGEAPEEWKSIYESVRRYDIDFWIIIVAAFLFVNFLEVILITNRYSKRISRSSIKESLDSMPIGICFFNSNGITLLANNLMQKLCYIITGNPIGNASLFADEVCGQIKQIGEEYYYFYKENIRLGRKNVVQLVAMNTTKLQLLTEELESKNIEIERLNKGLLEYSSNIDTLTRQKEILAAKSNIHDYFGRILLMTRISINNHERDYSKLVREWKECIALFRRGHSADNTHGINEQLMQIANNLNIRLTIDGDLTANPLYVKAVKECITNAVRHANASDIWVQIYEDGIIIKNNGNMPQNNIVEGGGLRYLRQSVEKAGGKMIIDINSEFCLKITQLGSANV